MLPSQCSPEYNKIIEEHPWNVSGFEQVAAEIKSFFIRNIPTTIGMF